MHPRDKEDAELAILVHAYIVARKKERQQQEETEQERVEERERGRRRPRSCWVRPWLNADRRHQLGHNMYSQLLNTELRCEDVSTYTNYVRMPPDLFDEILEKITPIIGIMFPSSSRFPTMSHEGRLRSVKVC